MSTTSIDFSGDHTTQEIVFAILTGIMTTSEEKRAILERDQALLMSEHAEQILEQLLSVARTMPDLSVVVVIFETYQAMFRRWRELGDIVAIWDEFFSVVSDVPSLENEGLKMFAAQLVNLGHALTQTPTGNHGTNQEVAIACFKATLQVLTITDYPTLYAAVQYNLGIAYRNRITGNRRTHLEDPISAFQEALRVYTLVDFPTDYADALNILGSLYKSRIAGNHRNNIEAAVACFQSALQVRTLDQFPLEHASIQNNLGIAFRQRIAGSRSDNIEAAIVCFQSALQVRTLDRFPLEHASIQNNLGIAYYDRIASNRRDNLEAAIGCFRAALKVFTIDVHPINYAGTQNNLGIVYENRIVGTRRDNIEDAILCYRAALQIYTLDNFPANYALTQNNLGNAYQDRIVGTQRDNLETAITCYRAALQVHTLDDFPIDHAMTQNNLGITYHDRIAGNRRDNLEMAIGCFLAALQVRIPDEFPIDYADTQNNLGAVFLDRIAGDHHDNLESAIAYFQAALQIRTINEFPLDYAKTKNNLGNAYRERLVGDQEHNLEVAIGCYQAALKIYTLADFPIDYRNTQVNLAWCYLNWVVPTAQARSASAEVRQAYAAAHQAYFEAHRAQAQLGWLEYDEQGRATLQGSWHGIREMYARDAWCLIQLGDTREAVVALEAGRAQALGETQAIASASTAEMCPTHATAFTQARDRLRSARLENERQVLRTARDEFLEVRTAIRAHCLPNFLSDRLQFYDINSAALDRVVCYLAATELGGFALVVPPAVPDASSIPLVIPLPRLTWHVVDEWLKRTNSTGEIVGGYQFAVHNQGNVLLAMWVLNHADESEIERRLKISIQAIPTALDPTFATLRTAFDRMVQAWEHEASLLEHSTEPKDAQKAAAWRSHLAMPLEEAIHKKVLGNNLGRFLQQVELEMVLNAMSETFMRELRHGLDVLGLNHPDQPLALIPCGRLGVLPVHAASARTDTSGASIPFLETCLLSLQPSARALTRTRELVAGLPKQGPVLTVGDPKLPTKSKLKQLARAEVEAKVITRVAKEANRTAQSLIGDEATLPAVLQALENIRAEHSGAWIHIASHGAANPADPQSCYMVLAQGEKLTLAQLQQSQLLAGTRLFIASGCLTALGDLETAPDELGSFAGGALQAGTACTIATLWSVSDQATFLLMLRFAQYLLGGEYISPSLALRSAVHWLRTATSEDLNDLKTAGLRGLKPLPRDDLGREVDEARGISVEKDEEVDGERMFIQEALDALPIFMLKAESLHPYDHPYFWAAAVVYGI